MKAQSSSPDAIQLKMIADRSTNSACSPEYPTEILGRRRSDLKTSIVGRIDRMQVLSLSLDIPSQMKSRVRDHSNDLHFFPPPSSKKLSTPYSLYDRKEEIIGAHAQP